MLNKIACNADNSVAIDHKGNVFVWGAGRHGLLGNPKQKLPLSKPARLPMRSDRNTLDTAIDQYFVATNVSLGQYHGAAVVNDIHTVKEFVPLLYAQHILHDFSEYLVNTIKPLCCSPQDLLRLEKDQIIEKALAYLFKDSEHTFPFVPESLVKPEILRLSYKDPVSTNKLLQDLADPDDEEKINLKQLRDQLVGSRCGNGKVFTWGVRNDGRLGTEISEQDKKLMDQNPTEIYVSKPQVIQFGAGVLIMKVSCGSTFSLALEAKQGHVYAWGMGNSGGLGLGEINKTNTPIKIKVQKNGQPFTNIKDISCGAHHCLALDNSGICYSWGHGQGGRLGNDDETGENQPKEIQGLRDVLVIRIAAGEKHSAAINNRNELYIWGVGLHGRLGNGKSSNLVRPTLCEDLQDSKVDKVALGSTHTLCLLKNGKGKVWGAGKYGKLGLEATEECNFGQPKDLIALEKVKVEEFACGPTHSMALTEDGDLYTWGGAKDGKLGYEESRAVVPVPRKILDNNKFYMKEVAIARASKYPLFTQYLDQFQVPAQFRSSTPCEIVQLSCGFNSTVFLLNNGEVWACGSNKYEQLGLNRKQLLQGKKGEKKNEISDDLLPPGVKQRIADLEATQDVEKPTKVTIVHEAVSQKVAQVSAGYFHVHVCTSEGMVFGWGRNDRGQLGIGKKVAIVNQPTRLKSLADKKVLMTANGQTHSLFLTDLGEVLACGFNEFGELGCGLQSLMVEKLSLSDFKLENGDFDEEAFMAHQRQQIETSIELTPKLVPGMEQIGYIACGKNHSIAIRSYKDSEKELRMYSWGHGWYGQTGHGSWQNKSKPEEVNVPLYKDTKFIMAACGSRHTIGLDTRGQIWFFGQKPSVGIEDLSEDKQFTPVKLEIPPHIRENFKFISTGEDHNLAISESGIVYGFGKNSFTKINQSKDLQNRSGGLVYFEQVDSDEKARLVACGAHHSVLADSNGVPYTWGNVTNGRCGLKFEEDSGSGKDQNISQPTVIYYLKLMFTREIQRFREMMAQEKQGNKRPEQDAPPDMEEEEKETRGQRQQTKQLVLPAEIKVELMTDKQREELQIYRFPVQKILKEQGASLNKDNLLKQDVFIQLSFQQMVKDFHRMIKSNQASFLDALYKAQNGVISRIYTFPAKIEPISNIKAELPKVIAKNKQLYEAIFCQLQIHPCYLIRWITLPQVSRSPKEVLHILRCVFGEKEIRDDPRVLHILMILARKVFQLEMENYDLKEILSGRTDSIFQQIFMFIFENQQQNIYFTTYIIQKLMKKLQNFYRKRTEKLEEEKDDNIEADKEVNFDYESVLQNANAHTRIDFLTEFMEICLQRLVKALDPKYRTSSAGVSITSEAFSLIYTIKSDIQQRQIADISTDDIDSYVLSILFEPIIVKLQEMNKEKLHDLYWDKRSAKMDVDEKVFKFQEKRNLVSVLADNLEKYFKRTKIHFQNAACKPLKDFIETGKKNNFNSIKFRERLGGLINHSPLEFDYLLMKDVFLNSMHFESPILSLSVRDLIFVYNNLVEKREQILFKDFPEDPVGIIIDELGGTFIQEKQGERVLISETIMDYKLNIEIKVRILEKNDTLARCSDCFAPVTETSLPFRRWNEAINGKQWKCQNEFACSSQPKIDADVMECPGCGRFRESYTLPRDSIFQRFRDTDFDPLVPLFEQVLCFLPTLENMQNLDKALAYELQVEESKKNCDYTKLSVIDQFKRQKAKFLTEKFGHLQLEDEGASRLALQAAEQELLSQLNQKVCIKYSINKRHETLQQSYLKLMREIRDKSAGYLQKHTLLIEEFNKIMTNAYTGLGSEFLKGEKQDIFAGKLHLKGQSNNGLRNKSGIKKKQLPNQKLQGFFDKLDKATANNDVVHNQEYLEQVANRELYRGQFSFFGKYPLYQLRQKQVLQSIQIHGKKLQTIMKKCSYVFHDDGDNGFKVELVYEEMDRTCFVIKNQSHEAILETFSIPKDTVAEMRRNKALKATVQFENSEFNVFELVNLLNEIKSKTYTYGIEPEGERKAPVQGKTVGLEDDNKGDDTKKSKRALKLMKQEMKNKLDGEIVANQQAAKI